MSVIRPLEPADAPALARLRVANRAFQAPFEPNRPDRFYTGDGQAERIADSLRAAAADLGYSFAILDEDGEVAGGITLSQVVRFPLESATVGYWVDRERNGRGLATRAVAAVVEEAFGPLGLHRVAAGTLVDNVASQRVLERNGFTRIGLARKHLLIGGAWRDHLLFECLADDL